MSISLALSNALSGLNVTSRAVSLVADNVANAQTEGYAARELSVSSMVTEGRGEGVRVDGVLRRVDKPLLADRRLSDASLANSDTRASALNVIEDLIGGPTETGSLSERVAQLSSDMLAAASRPDSTGRLESLSLSASRVAEFLNEASDGIQAVRLQADKAIAQDVITIQESLAQIESLDRQIVQMGQGPQDISGLLDQRQIAIDRIAPIIPVRELPRDDGRIALYTTGGALLYDVRVAEVDFSGVNTMTYDLSFDGDDLSGITLNGVEHGADLFASRISGGRLHANLQVRDQIGVEAQASLDAFARDLVERFQDPGLDPTLTATDPGLFTDGGNLFDPTNELGVSSRIALNVQADPTAGGAVWRLRDGMNAAAPGTVGDASLLNALQIRLDDPRAVASGPAAGSVVSVAEMAGELYSISSSKSVDADRILAYETARQDSLRTAELSNGVDTDAELRNLLVLEQAYAANARVISVLDGLMDEMLRI